MEISTWNFPGGNFQVEISTCKFPNGNFHLEPSKWKFPLGNFHLENSKWNFPFGNFHLGVSTWSPRPRKKTKPGKPSILTNLSIFCRAYEGHAEISVFRISRGISNEMKKSNFLENNFHLQLPMSEKWRSNLSIFSMLSSRRTLSSWN